MAVNKCFIWKCSPGISLDFYPSLSLRPVSSYQSFLTELIFWFFRADFHCMVPLYCLLCIRGVIVSGPAREMFPLVLVTAVWAQHGSKLWYSYSLKREEFLQGIGLKLLLINILEILTIKWKTTREVANWKKVASPSENKVATQNT